MRKAFTLIELLVVIAIIAILAAILFPVFSQAKESAKLSQATSQMRQLSVSVMLYTDSQEDLMPMATNYGTDTKDPNRIWPPAVMPYIKSKDILIAPGSNGRYAKDWSERSWMTIGYNQATGYDPQGCKGGEADPSICEGYVTSFSAGATSEPAKAGLFATTPGGESSGQYRGYVFSPFNSNDDQAIKNQSDDRLKPPLVADRDMVPDLVAAGKKPAQCKPIFARYRATGKDDGVTPIIFADGHAKSYNAKQIRSMSSGIHWRIRSGG